MAGVVDLFAPSLLAEMVEQGMVSVKAHPDQAADLWISNYTAAAQYTNTWNAVTRQCRGLITGGHPVTDASAIVVARPFEKFFNLSEHDTDAHKALPLDRRFVVEGKMDGSLGILYEAPDGPAIATRGSFSSDQALWATAFLRRVAPGWAVPTGVTLLFEIVYPTNRIVVDYGDHEGLTLLAAIDVDTGADVSVPEAWKEWRPVVQIYDGIDIGMILRLIATSPQDWVNHEGFVLRFTPASPGLPSLRVKAKFAEYVRLHRIVTGVSTKTVWELLSTGHPLAELLDRVPDEFAQWVQATADELQARYDGIEQSCRALMTDARVDSSDRKSTALFFAEQPHRSVLFKMLDDKDPSALIWRMIKPLAEKPFRSVDGAEPPG